MRPVIGVMPLVDEDKESLWMLPGYFGGIMEAGGIPIMLPLSDDSDMLVQCAEMCDGFLFTGGQDVSPEIYGESPLDDSVVCCAARDAMEGIILRYALERDKSVLGICRGIQLINASLGGTLFQDLPKQYPSSVEHHQKQPYSEPAHRVNVLKGTPLYELLGKEELAVNTVHHQAVKDVSPELEKMAVSEDGIVEAVYHPQHRFIWAVQWHPEYSHVKDADSRKIFQRFVESAKK